MVFFFKQKTAYEMRISDWSSDVCSSDLLVMAIVEPLLAILDQLARLTKQVQDIVRGEEVCRRLMSAPGVGPNHRARISGHDRPAGALQTIWDVGAHLGLTPARYQSGETDIQRSEEHTYELQSLMRISYAVFCLTKKKKQ